MFKSKSGFNPALSGRLKIILIGVMLLVFGIMIWVYIRGSRPNNNQMDKPLFPIPAATLSIGNIKHTATRDGITEWELEAGSGQYLEDSKKVIITDLKIAFYLENKTTALLKARQGVLNTHTNDISVTGKVIFENQGLRLETDEMIYNHKAKTMSSNKPITVKNNMFHITADQFRMNLTENKTYLSGHVTGTFNEIKSP